MKQLHTLMAVLLVLFTQTMPARGMQFEDNSATTPSETVAEGADSKPEVPLESRIFLNAADANQPESIGKLTTALEQTTGVVATRKAIGGVHPTRFEERMVVGLHIVPTESYKAVEGFIQGLSDLKLERPLFVQLYANPNEPSEVRIETGTKVSMADAQLVRDYIANQKTLSIVKTLFIVEGRAVPIPDTATAKVIEPPFRVTFLCVKPDWSQGPAAKEIETELRATLKGATLPTELLDQLPASGPKIFFAGEIVSYYSAEHYAQFLAWLNAKDLILESSPFGKLQRTPDATKKGESAPQMMMQKMMGGGKGPQSMANRFSTTQLKEYNFLDLMPIRDPVSQPFLSRKPQFQWTVELVDVASTPEGTNVGIHRWLSIWEQARGSVAATQAEVLDSSSTYFGLDHKTVAVINLFSDAGEQTYRDAANRKGFEGVLVIERDPVATDTAPVTPKLDLPDRVVTLPRRTSLTRGDKSPLANPRGAGGGRSGRNPLAQSQAPASPAGTGGTSSRPTAPQQQVPNAKAGDDVTNLNVAFRTIDANAAAEMVKKLYPASDLVIVPDPSGKVLFARGNRQAIAEIQKLFEQLDTPPVPAQQSIPGQQVAGNHRNGGSIEFTLQPSAIPLDQLREEYATAEKRTMELAAQVREKQAQLQPKDPQRLQFRKQLSDAVQAAFAARQQLLQAEVAAFQQRALGIQQSIQLRNRVQDKIVERRVADLLDPFLEWDANQLQQRTPVAPVPSSGEVAPALPNPTTTAVGGQPTYVLPSEEPPVKEIPPPPEDVAKMSQPDPGSATAWIELTFTQEDPDGRQVSSALYVNGAVVSADGLVVCTLPPGMTESQVLKMARRATLFVGTEYAGVTMETGRIVASESATGLGLIRCDHAPFRFFTPDDTDPAINKQVYLHGKTGKKKEYEVKQLEISGLAPTKDDRRFHVNFDGGEELHGAALIDTANRLQGILAQRIPRKPVPDRPSSQPNPPNPPEPTGPSYAISGQDILALIARYRKSPSATGNVPSSARMADLKNASGQGVTVVVPALGPKPLALDFGFPIRKGASGADQDTVARVDPELLGVWELTQPDGKPAPNGLRLVFLKNHLAVYINGQRTSSWLVAGTDSSVSPKRIALLMCEGTASQYGIYEVKDNGLRLNVGPDPTVKQTTFGTERPEFRLVSREVPAEIQESMQKIPPTRDPLDKGTADANPEQLQFQMILFDIEKQAASKLLQGLSHPIDRSGGEMSPVQCSVPSDFDALLRQLGQDGKVNMLSRPQIRTLLGQSASVEVGQLVGEIKDQKGNRVPLPTGFKVQVLPWRRIDTSLQLDFSVKIRALAKSLPPIKEGDVILPGINALAFQTSVTVPSDGQILFLCPGTGDSGDRLTFMYVAKLPIETPEVKEGSTDK